MHYLSKRYPLRVKEMLKYNTVTLDIPVILTPLHQERNRRFIVVKRFTRSLNEKSSLRNFLEKWRGSKYTPEELQQGVDLENLIGLNATLFIVHNETEERTYANIESILPYKGKNGTVLLYDLLPSGEYIRVKDCRGSRVFPT